MPSQTVPLSPSLFTLPNTAIHCPTEALAISLLALADELGYKWGSGRKCLGTTHYNVYGEDICYVFNEKCKEVGYSDRQYYRLQGRTVLALVESFSLLSILAYQSTQDTDFQSGSLIITKRANGDLSFPTAVWGLRDPQEKIYTKVDPKKYLSPSAAFSTLLQGKQVSYDVDGKTYTFDLNTSGLNGTQLNTLTFYTLS